MKALSLVLLFSLWSLAANAAPDVNTINSKFGFNIFPADKTDWQMTAFRKRSGIRLNGSAGHYSARFRKTVLDAPAEELSVYTAPDGKTIERISIVFANKGDTVDRHKSKIKAARRSVSSQLTGQFGAPSRKSFYAGTLREKTDMWKFNGTELYLEVSKKEFLMLHIVPAGKNQTTQKSDGRDYSKNVKTNKFGDHWIPNIPMVDQGAKGYCVPATMARVFLYYGIKVDMHHLAKIGDTSRSGGTDTDRIIKDVKSMRRRCNLKCSGFSGLSVRTVARYIDKGFPIMWVMFSTRELQQVYIFSRLNRHKAASPQEWERSLKKISIPQKEDGPHLCLIIGYNRITDEIAVSNSWGDAHIAPTWIPMKVARKVCRNNLTVFSP